MDYGMSELVPIVGKLAEKYTGHEHTSISYEKAEQLMEAVLYCICETEKENTEFVEMSENAQNEFFSVPELGENDLPMPY